MIVPVPQTLEDTLESKHERINALVLPFSTAHSWPDQLNALLEPYGQARRTRKMNLEVYVILITME